ncbi:hypothetical protein OG399_15420 [Streptomyces achromogenes]|uniref:hypothetical protein n=1 Tax=Streptomyces achromogenes TaxID=67255 RepID=UPI00324CC595
MRIVMQPAGLARKVVKRHFQDTIVRPVDIDEHADLLEPEITTELKRLFPGGTAPMWGVTPGGRNVNVAKFRKMRPGDWVFFTGEKKVYFGGTVALMWRNRELAEQLWGADDDGNTWEYMYALSGTRSFNIPMDEVRELLGWKPARNVMGFIVLSESESDTLQALLTLDPANASTTPLDPRTEQAAVDAFDGELERKAQRAQRGEQAVLKRRLLPGITGACALCGRELPGTFLIGAHIKKRSMCTDTEKRDLANIAMLACVFGCDALYEHGYVTVAPGGDIQVSPLVHDIPEVAAYIKHKLEHRTVTWWNEDREPYYNWHRIHTFKAGLPA